MALGGPKVPYTPQRGWAPQPVIPERRTWVLAVGIAVLVGLVSLVLYSLATVPVQGSEQVAFNIDNPTGSPTLQVANVTFDRSGSLGFSWNSNDLAIVNVSVVDPQGTTIYSKIGYGGSASFTVVRGEPYRFETREVGAPTAVTVEFSGTLLYSAPLL